MKKTAILTLALASLVSLKASAEVEFLPNADENKYVKTDTASTAQRCQNAGYTYTNETCSSTTHGQVEKCPYSDSYFKTCCPEGYVHKLSECVSDISPDNCHGYYKCNAPSVQELCANEGYTNSRQIVAVEDDMYVSVMAINLGDIIEDCPYSNDYYKIISSAQRCRNEGYQHGTVNAIACTTVTCPYNSAYTKADCSAARTCMDNGYSLDPLGSYCNGQGYIVCPQNSDYTKCL